MSKLNNAQILTLALILLLLTSFLHAEVPQMINYQGRLTDDAGNPINNSVFINFKIFANDIETGDSVWSSGSQLVQVTDGLFTYQLGSNNPIPAEIFHESELYLSLTFGNDPELPRNRLITVPYAFSSINSDTAYYARNISGVVSTQPGSMLINNEAGDSAFVFSADALGHFLRIVPPDPCVPPEPCIPAMEMKIEPTTGPSFNIYDVIGQVMGFEPMPFNEGFLMKLIDPGDDGKLLELVGNHATNEAGIYLIDPGDDGHTISLTSSLNAGSFKMFNPQPEPPAILFEVNATSTNGASLSIYDEIGQVMGFEPSPFNQGYGLKFFNAHAAEPKDNPLVEVISAYSETSALGHLALHREYIDYDNDSVVMTPNGIELWEGGIQKAHLMPSTIKLTGGNAGDVLVSDANGVGTWQLPPTIGNWCDEGTFLEPCDTRGLAQKGAILRGSNDTSHINFGHASTTGSVTGNNEGCTISGGSGNEAFGDFSTIGGGRFHDAYGGFSTIAGGFLCNAEGEYAFIGGGRVNEATGQAATCSGGWLSAANGDHSTVPGGYKNIAAGNNSFAAGREAKALHDGSMVFCANQFGTDSVFSGGVEHVVFFAGGGMYITNVSETAPYDPNKLINTSTGAYLSSSGSWINSSSYTLKENYQDVNSQDILNKIEQLPITMWNYIGNEEAKHIGPISEEFYTIFEIGENDETISTIDPSGVALAGIKGLIEENKELKKTVEDLIKRIETLEKKDK